MKQNQVILVDENDAEVGTADKMQVHVSGELHRAFSVFLFDAAGRHILQRRAHHKYHTAGLFSNACCSHPAPGESVAAAVERRLQEELGVNCPVRPVLKMRYRCVLDDGLVEHEYDHIFVGTCTGALEPNPEEVAEIQLLDDLTLLRWLDSEPSAFTPWFRLALPDIIHTVRNPDQVNPPRVDLKADGTVAAFLPVTMQTDA